MPVLYNPPNSERSWSSGFNRHLLDSTLDSSRGWCPRQPNGHQWLQFDNVDPSLRITGLVFQRRRDYAQWVKTYRYSYYTPGVASTGWSSALNTGMDRIGWWVPADRIYDSPLPTVLTGGTRLRIQALTWHHFPCMRIGFKATQGSAQDAKVYW